MDKIKNAEIIKQIKKLVEDACKRRTNPFGYRAWQDHVLPTVKYAKILAKKLKADVEVVEIAAYLHDYAGIVSKDMYLEHHAHGARLAEEILEKFKYPKSKIEMVKHCIYAHRASRKIPKQSKEAEIVAVTDSMAHFENVTSLLYLAYVKHKMDSDEGRKWVLAKLERSWKKLTPEAKDVIKDKYQAIKKVLSF